MRIAMPSVEETLHSQTQTQPPPREDVMPNGRLRVDGLSETDRNFAVAMHLSPLAFFFIGPLAFAAPLVLWLIRKDQSGFNDDHGRETVNFLITYILFSILLVWTIIVPIVLMVIAIVSMIRGALASTRGEYFRYPMTIRFLT
jgi:uncharacterized Tic20 family protein